MSKSITNSDIAEKFEWWGYIHENNTIQVKRYWDKQDLQDARESDFVQRVFGPFLVSGKEEAIEKIKEIIEEEIHQK